MTEITKEFGWECAHRLFDKNLNQEENRKEFGLCFEAIHGHSYIFFVTIENIGPLKHGMVINFKDLKKIVNEKIVNIQDHTLNLSEGDPLIKVLENQNLRINIWKEETTCEKEIAVYWNILEKEFLKINIKLKELRLYETKSSFATLRK